MTKAHVNKLDNEQLSALLDGEQQLTDEQIATQEIETVGRYALIGDTMRAKQDNQAFVLDISGAVAGALSNEPVHADFSKNNAEQQVVKQSDNVVAFKWRKPLAQFAIAASVAMFAIVGVQTLPQGDESKSEIPMLQTTPVTGVASPVSYSSEPALDNAAKGLRELQQQRIGALVLEHQRQARVAYSLEKAHTESNGEKEKN